VHVHEVCIFYRDESRSHGKDLLLYHILLARRSHHLLKGVFKLAKFSIIGLLFADEESVMAKNKLK